MIFLVLQCFRRFFTDKLFVFPDKIGMLLLNFHERLSDFPENLPKMANFIEIARKFHKFCNNVRNEYFFPRIFQLMTFVLLIRADHCNKEED